LVPQNLALGTTALGALLASVALLYFRTSPAPAAVVSGLVLMAGAGLFAQRWRRAPLT
jgi:LPXTG-motif cell wall-anchored protein